MKIFKGNNYLKKTALVGGLLFFFIQTGCTDSGESGQNSVVNSNVQRNSAPINTNQKSSLSNEANVSNTSVSRNNPPIDSGENLSANPGLINQSGQTANNDPNYPNGEQMSSQSGSIPVAPQINNREIYSPDSRAVKEMESLPDTPIMSDLEFAIDRWSNSEAASYGMRATLVSLWRQKNPTINYNPIGVDDLTGRIRARPSFANCRRARQLNRNMFHDEGIRTVGQLYDYLEPCGTEN